MIKVKNKSELQEEIKESILQNGLHADLNYIDISLITDLSQLFYWSDFDGDISKWNTSNVEDMSGMFANSNFNNNISRWDVSSVTDMSWMFNNSEFVGGNWRVEYRKCKKYGGNVS
jgi:surface protein